VPASVIQHHYVDALGVKHRPTAATLATIRRAMREPARGGRSRDDGPLVLSQGDPKIVGPATVRLESGTEITVGRRLPADLPAGYHQIVREGHRPSRLIVAPRTCFLPRDLRAWGWAIQLYSTRSRRSWGIGDLSDLRRIGAWAKAQGAGFSLASPLSAPLPLVPQQPSPYFPSSRLFRSLLFLSVEDVPGARGIAEIDSLARRAHVLNRDRRIDRDAIYGLKLEALERLWTRARLHDDDGFERYEAEQGAVLQDYATFCALAEEYGCGRHGWPADVRHPRAPGIARVLRRPRTRDRVRFHKWVQYQLDRQLARAAAVLPVMQDLPIGFDADGADAWSFQDVLAEGISVGAPPDEFNTRGQNWGLPPFVPNLLRADGYEPFIQTIRASLRHAAGLRIDHVMGLFRLFWIPAGKEPAAGAYVRLPSDDLLAIVALESQRARAVIVGEDLGTVEEATRHALAEKLILSYRLVWFEKRPPSTFPELSLSAITTHDLPTVAGLWSGSDLEAQRQLQLAPNEAGTQEIQDRIAKMTKAVRRTPASTVIARLHAQLATAPSRLLTATLEDAEGVEERPNMPATTNQWPNWSIALPMPIERLKRSKLARAIARALNRNQRPPVPARRQRRA